METIKFIIKTDNHFYKRNNAGSPPETTGRHYASLYKSEDYVKVITNNLRIKHPKVKFEIENY